MEFEGSNLRNESKLYGLMNTLVILLETRDFPGGSDSKASVYNVGDLPSLGWKICWRRKWQSTLVLLPGKSAGQRSLVGYSPWGCQESDTTERLHFLSAPTRFAGVFMKGACAKV